MTNSKGITAILYVAGRTRLNRVFQKKLVVQMTRLSGAVGGVVPEVLADAGQL